MLGHNIHTCPWFTYLVLTHANFKNVQLIASQCCRHGNISLAKQLASNNPNIVAANEHQHQLSLRSCFCIDTRAKCVVVRFSPGRSQSLCGPVTFFTRLALSSLFLASETGLAGELLRGVTSSHFGA